MKGEYINMKRKIENYLKSKDKNEYNHLDKLFELYLHGNIEKLLSMYSGVAIYPIIDKLGKTIQLNYNYRNIYVTIDFFEDKYSVIIFPANVKIANFEKSIIDYDYQDDFNLEELINEIDEIIKNHSSLKDTTLIEKKKKTCSLIAWISLCLSFVICIGIALYCVITRNNVKGDMWWGIFFIVIPLIVWFTFDVKSKRIK